MSFQDTLKKNFENYININNLSNNDYRTSHFNRFIDDGLPTLKNENWKYTPLNFIYNNEFNLLLQSNEEKINLESLKSKIFIPTNANIITLINGVYFQDNTSIPDNNLLSITQSDHFSNNEINDQVLNNSQANDVFYNLNCALTAKETQIDVNSNSNPIVLVLYFRNNSQLNFINNRFKINFGSNSTSDVYIYSISEDLNPIFVNNYFSFNFKENSKSRIYFYQNEKDNYYQINNITINQDSDSSLKFYTFSLNGNFTRNFFRNSINGKGSESILFGLYIAKNNQLIDNHILMIHNSPNCHSNQLFKGILQDNSRGVFNGKILVQQNAQKTDAYQSNKNILTTKDASIFTKPELEIYADDVKCSHGATSGFLQNEELFYLQARGIDENIAKSLLLKGFAGDVVEKVENINFKDWLYSEIDKII
jgi:Fe-S cluster assembly protein SufD